MQVKTEKKGITKWKDGCIKLSNGKQYFGEVCYFIVSGSLSEYIEFRKEASEFSQIFLADTCDAVKWGELGIIIATEKVQETPR